MFVQLCFFRYIVFSLYFFLSSFTSHAKCVLMLHNHTGGTIFILCTRYSVKSMWKPENIYIYLCTQGIVSKSFSIPPNSSSVEKYERWTLNTFSSVFVEFATCQNFFLSFYLGEFMVGPVYTASAYKSVKLKQIIIIFPKHRSSLHTRRKKRWKKGRKKKRKKQ